MNHAEWDIEVLNCRDILTALQIISSSDGDLSSDNKPELIIEDVATTRKAQFLPAFLNRLEWFSVFSVYVTLVGLPYGP